MEKIVIHWFRRDLRLEDNHSLYRALTSGLKVVPIFIFDKNILKKLDKKDRRVSYIHSVLENLNKQLFEKYHSGIEFYFDTPKNAFEKIIKKYNVYAVYINKDYEPYAVERDKEIQKMLYNNDILFYSFKDHVLFEEREIVKENGEPFLVYTHYANAWKKKFFNEIKTISIYPSEQYLNNLYTFSEKTKVPDLTVMGFEKVDFILHPLDVSENLLFNYQQTRDYIDNENGTSHSSVYLRFGIVSTRSLIEKGLQYNQIFLNELIWREFFQMILYHYPESSVQNFRKDVIIPWENNEEYFEKWKNGMTGFPIIDAAMRELKQTGYMHNRCRMIVANFLTKILLIDWRWGERYFAKLLMDYEMASNVGNWQWSAGTGVDAAPYFRIFNPYLQQEKFDPQFKYIKKWLPEYKPNQYLKPIVNYDERRKKFLELLKKR